jgi:nitrite reductase/ring-hydroxylating ferredoxin subunit
VLNVIHEAKNVCPYIKAPWHDTAMEVELIERSRHCVHDDFEVKVNACRAGDYVTMASYGLQGGNVLACAWHGVSFSSNRKQSVRKSVKKNYNCNETVCLSVSLR